jgi:hypothetical protein
MTNQTPYKIFIQSNLDSFLVKMKLFRNHLATLLYIFLFEL